MDIVKGFPNTPLVIIGYPGDHNLQKAVSVCVSLIGYVEPTHVLESSALLTDSPMYRRFLTDDEKRAITGTLGDKMSLDWIQSKAGMLQGVRDVLRVEREKNYAPPGPIPIVV